MGKPDKEEDLLVDEEEVEEELEHLEEQKKRREKKLKERHRKQRRVIITIALLAAIAVAVVFTIRAQKAKEAAADATVSIETAEDEELIYAKVISIKGNDMDVSILKAAEAGTDAGTVAGTDAGKGAASDGTHAGPPSDGTQAAPAASDGTQAAPAAGGSQTPPSFGQNSASNETQYTETGETKSYEIPVGTEVITKTGTETTFARLSVDNTLAIVVKKDTDNIIRIYIQ